MANQVYFPQYKQLFEADSEGFIIISHPTTQRAFKIKISDFIDTVATLVASSLISTDDPNALVLGTDDLLQVDNIYSADGTLTGDRLIDADGNSFGISDAETVEIGATDFIELKSDSGTGESYVTVNSGDVSILSDDGLDSSQIIVSATNIEVTAGSLGMTLDIGAGLNGDALSLLNSSTNEIGWLTPTKIYKGTGTLSSGTVAVADTNVTASCKILISPNAVSGNTGNIRVTARTPGVGFTVTSITDNSTSTATTDNSTFDYIIVD